MNTAAALGIAAYLALVTTLAAWAIRGWRRERRQAARIVRANGRARLTRQMHLRRDTRPAPIDNTCLQLEALYHAPAHTERGNQ